MSAYRPLGDRAMGVFVWASIAFCAATWTLVLLASIGAVRL